MIDTQLEPNLQSPEFRALTAVVAALAETLDKVDLLEVFTVKLQRVAVDLETDAPPEDPAMKWLDNLTTQLLRS